MLAIRVTSQAPPSRGELCLSEPCALDFASADDPLRIPSDRMSTAPLTWLFVGDSFQPAENGTRDKPGFVELFTAGLRNNPVPRNDPVVDACTPRFRMRDVLEGFHERIQQRNPSAVFLLCGAADPDAGMSSLPEFENALLRVARRLEDQRTPLVLNTSPVPYHVPDHPTAAAHLIYAEAVRGIAAELDLPLVDHRLEWEQSAVPPGSPGSWYEEDGRHPSARGHRRIATKLIRASQELGATGAFPSVPSGSDATM